MKKFKDILLEGKLNVNEIIKNSINEIEEWFPDDEREEFYNAKNSEKISMIDGYIDDFFDKYYNEKDMDFISNNRKKIIQGISKKL